MPRPHRQPHEAQAAQQGADRPLGQRHVEALRDHRGEIGPSPAHHAVHGRVGAGPNQLGNDRRLLGRQAKPWADRAAPVRQPRQALVVVAMYPVTQRLPVHAARAASARDAPSSTSASASIRRAATASRLAAAARRKPAASWSLRVIVIAAMCVKAPLPKHRIRCAVTSGIPFESQPFGRWY